MKKYDIDEYFTEKASAKDMNRPQLQLLLKIVRKGDTVYIKDFSRIARSTKDLLEIVEKFEKEGVKLISVKEALDSSTPNGKFFLTMLGAIYEFERANIKERQLEGIAIAKKQGKFKGRKQVSKPDNWSTVYEKYRTRQITAKQAMAELNLKTNTFYNFVAKEN